jgi:F-type H+-transporting ATPase subunit b
MTIDWWTLGIQTVNVAILVWLLRHFFWRPVAAMIEQRRDATRRTLAEAAATRAEATAALAAIEQTRAGFAKEREAILAAAHDAAEQARTARLAQAEQESANIAANAAAAIETARQAAEHAWTERSARLAVDIAGQLAARLDGAAVREAFLNWLVAEIWALPDAVRHAEAASGAALEVVSATALDPPERERAQALIGAAMGGAVSFVFHSDPTLIAGLELHGANLRISNSWRADLARILAALSAKEATNGVPSPPVAGKDRVDATHAH